MSSARSWSPATTPAPRRGCWPRKGGWPLLAEPTSGAAHRHPRHRGPTGCCSPTPSWPTGSSGSSSVVTRRLSRPVTQAAVAPRHRGDRRGPARCAARLDRSRSHGQQGRPAAAAVRHARPSGCRQGGPRARAPQPVEVAAGVARARRGPGRAARRPARRPGGAHPAPRRPRPSPGHCRPPGSSSWAPPTRSATSTSPFRATGSETDGWCSPTVVSPGSTAPSPPRSGPRSAGRTPAVRFALVGDVTFLHDSNALVIGPDEPRPDLTVVVVNDDGGSIFALLEQGAEAHARVVRADLRHAARGRPRGSSARPPRPRTRGSATWPALEAALDDDTPGHPGRGGRRTP